MVKAVNIQIFTNTLGKREDVISQHIASQLRHLSSTDFPASDLLQKNISASVKSAEHTFLSISTRVFPKWYT